MLYTLRYQDELKGIKGFELPSENLKEARVTTKEIDLAKRLIDDMTDKWDPSAYKDTYHKDLMVRINEKIKGGETHEITQSSGDESQAPHSAQVIDLAALLQKSIGTGGARKKAAPTRRPKAGTKPTLRVVQSGQGASRPAAKRRRA